MSENIPPTSRNLFGGSPLSPISVIGGGGVSKAPPPPHRLDNTVAPGGGTTRPTSEGSTGGVGGPPVAAVQNVRPKPVVIGKSTTSNTAPTTTTKPVSSSTGGGVAVVPRPKGLAGGNPTTIASEMVARPATARQVRTSRPSSAAAIPKPQKQQQHQPASATNAATSTSAAVPAPDGDGKYFTGLFAEEHKRLYLEQRDRERRGAEWGNKVKAEERRLYDAARQYTGVPTSTTSRPSSAAPRGGGATAVAAAPRVTKSPPQPFRRTQSGGLSKRPPPPAPWHEPSSSPVHHTTDNTEWEQHVRQVHDEQRQRQTNNHHNPSNNDGDDALDTTALPPQTFIVSPRIVEEEEAAAEAAAASGTTVTAAGRVRVLPSKVSEQEVVGASPCPVPPHVDDVIPKPTTTAKATKPTVTKTKKKVPVATRGSSPSAAKGGGKGGATNTGASPAHQPATSSSTGLVVVNYYARCDHCSKLIGVQYEHPSAADMGHHTTSAMATTAALNKLVKQRKEEASALALSDHYDSGDCPLVPLKCELTNSETGDECGHILRGGALMLEHQTNKCSNRVVPCPNYVAVNDHEGGGHDEDAASMSCHKLVSAGSIGLHLQRCAAEMVQCRHCRAFFLESEEMKRLEIAAEREEKRELRHGVVVRGATDKVESAAAMGQSVTASQSSRPTSPRLAHRSGAAEDANDDDDDANVGGEVLASSIASLRLSRNPTLSRNASMRFNRIATGNLGGGEEDSVSTTSAKGHLEAIHRHIEDHKVERYGWVRRGDLSRHYSLCPNKLVPCPVPGCLLCTRQQRQRVANAAATATAAGMMSVGGGAGGGSFVMDASLTFNTSVNNNQDASSSSPQQMSYYSPLLNRKASSRKLLLGRDGGGGDQSPSSSPASKPLPSSSTTTTTVQQQLQLHQQQLLRRAEVPNHVEHVISIICKASTRYAQDRLALDDPPGPISSSAASPGKNTNAATNAAGTSTSPSATNTAPPPTAAALVVKYVKAFCNDNHIAKIKSLPTTLIPPPSSSVTSGLPPQGGNSSIVPPDYVLRCLEKLGANPTCYLAAGISGDGDGNNNRVLTSRDVEGNISYLLSAASAANTGDGGNGGGRRARSMTPAAALVAVSADDPIITLSVVLQSLVHDRISSTVHAHFAQRSSIKREVHVLEVQHAMITAYQTKRRNEEVDALNARIAELEAKLAAAKSNAVTKKPVVVDDDTEEVPTAAVAEDEEEASTPQAEVESPVVEESLHESKEEDEGLTQAPAAPADDVETSTTEPLPDSQPDVLAPEPVRHDTTYTTPMTERRRRIQQGIITTTGNDVSGGGGADDTATNEALAASLGGYSIGWEGTTGGGGDEGVAAEDDDGEIYGSPFILDESSASSSLSVAADNPCEHPLHYDDEDLTPASDDVFEVVVPEPSEPTPASAAAASLVHDVHVVDPQEEEKNDTKPTSPPLGAADAHHNHSEEVSPTTVADDDHITTHDDATDQHHDYVDGGGIPVTLGTSKESPSPEHPSINPPAPDCATRCGSLMPPPHNTTATTSLSVGGDDDDNKVVGLEKEVGVVNTTTAAQPKPTDADPRSSSQSDDGTVPTTAHVPTTNATITAVEVNDVHPSTTTTDPTPEVAPAAVPQQQDEPQQLPSNNTEEVVNASPLPSANPTPQVLPLPTQPSSEVACITIDRRLMSLLPTDDSRSEYEEVIRQVQLVFSWFHSTSGWAKATKGQEEISPEDQSKAESLQLEVKSQVENITSLINTWRNSVSEENTDTTAFSDPQLRSRISYVSEDLDQELTQLRLQQHRIKSSLYSIAWAA